MYIYIYIYVDQGLRPGSPYWRSLKDPLRFRSCSIWTQLRRL